MRTPPGRRQQRVAGQSLTEVIIIIFLVAVGTVGLVGLFGDNIRNLFGASAAAIAGTPDVGNSGKLATKTKWTLKGGSLSQYNSAGVSNKAYNPGGGPNNSIAPGGGYNPGGSPNNSANW
jgi:Flp pilus assembly pilin Flp